MIIPSDALTAASVLAILTIALGAYIGFLDGDWEKAPGLVAALIMFAGGCVFLLVLAIFGILTAVRDLFEFALNPKSPRWLGSIATLVAAMLGFSLFQVRLRWRAIYGATEVIVGLAIIFYEMEKRRDATPEASPWEVVNLQLFFWVLSASVYVIVRGLDNVHQGWAKDPVALRVQEWVKRLKSQ